MTTENINTIHHTIQYIHHDIMEGTLLCLCLYLII